MIVLSQAVAEAALTGARAGPTAAGVSGERNALGGGRLGHGRVGVAFECVRVGL